MTVPCPEDRLELTAAVLAGGRSMRMGVDKTLLDIDGEPLLVRVAEIVSGVCAHTIVVTNRPDAARSAGLAPGIPVIRDEVAYQGPLGGLVTALAAAQDLWVLAVAADMPWLEPAVVRALWELRDDADVVMPFSDKGPEPLLAIYRVETCLPVAREMIASGRRRIVAMLAGLKVVEVPEAALRSADPDLRSLVNVNTPEDLAEVRADAVPLRHQAGVRLKVIDQAERSGHGMPVERPVTLYMNDVEVATVQATPADLDEMAAGFMLSEGLLSDREALGRIDVDAKRGLVYLATSELVPEDLVHKTRYVTSGCGKGVTFSSVGHARDIARIESNITVASEELYELMGQMTRRAALYRDTGGTHACALARDGHVCIVREDVGRHNALDKLVGRAWLERVPTSGSVLLTTGRISYEMTVKVAKSRVPIVVSRTAITDLAADIAHELGITLVGYARGGKLVVYTHPERVLITQEEGT